jgi:hypothetical protein
MEECFSTAPPKFSNSHGIDIAFQLPVFCTIIKVYRYHNPMKLNTAYQLDDYADNLKYFIKEQRNSNCRCWGSWEEINEGKHKYIQISPSRFGEQS